MDLNFTPQEEAFREEVHAFLAQNLSPALSAKVAAGQHLSKAEMEAMHNKCAAMMAPAGAPTAPAPTPQ